MFLQSLAADEVEDRLGIVNKAFPAAAVVTPFPLVWTTRLPDAHVVKDKDTLDLDPGSYDLVIHALGLHWSNDPVGQLIQCRRALKPDGLFLCVTLGGQTLHELRSVLAQAETKVTGGLSPRVAPMGEIRDLGALLQRAGFAMPVADSVTQRLEHSDVWHLMRDLRQMGEANALDARLRRPTPPAIFETANDVYRTHFATENETVLTTFEFVTLTGWAPGPDQPQPLRPGSAQQRLADALGSAEHKLLD